MKKAMLFLIALLFSVSASAATLTLTGDGVTAVDDTTSVISLTGESGSGIWTITSDESLTYAIAVTFITDITSTVSLLDDTGTLVASIAATSTGLSSSVAYLLVSLIAGVTYTLEISNLATLTQASISAVPLPTTAFLFSPVLLGLIGLRRKYKSIAA